MTPGSWEAVSLEDVCEILDRLRKPITKRDRKPGPFPYYGASGILDQVEGYIFDEPLVLLGEDGAKWEAGENSAFPINGKTWVNNHAHVIRPDRDRLLDEWLIYYLNFQDLTEFVSGLTVPKLNQKSLKAIPIPLPPLSEQRRIVSVLDAAFAGLATAEANTRQNLTNARELFDSHLNDLFTERVKNWGKRELGEVAGFQNGFAFKSKLFGTKGMPVLRIGNIQNDTIVDSNLVYTDPDDYEEDLSRYEVKPGDLLIAMSGATTGKVGFNDTAACFLLNQRVGKFEPSQALNTNFLFLFLKTKVASNLEDAAGAAQPNLSTKQIKSLKIPLPSSEEQDAIVYETEMIRDKTDGIYGKAKLKLTALAALKQSLLHRAFRGELSGHLVAS